MYQLNGQIEGTFTVWTRNNLESGEVTWKSMADALDQRGAGAIAVVSELRDPPSDFEIIGETSDAVWSDENFLVVRLRSN